MRQRGFTWVGLVAILVGLAGLVGSIVLAQHEYRSSIDEARKSGLEDGRTKALKEVDERDNAQLKAVMKERDDLVSQIRDLESKRDKAIADKEAQYAKKLAAQQADYDSFIADINAGRVMWRDPGQTGGCAPVPRDGAPSEVAAGSGGGDGQLGGGGLSAEAERFLVGEAKRANSVVTKLNLCRDVIKSERIDASG